MLPHLVDFPLLCSHQEQVVDLFVEVEGGATALEEEGTDLGCFSEGGSHSAQCWTNELGHCEGWAQARKTETGP